MATPPWNKTPAPLHPPRTDTSSSAASGSGRSLLNIIKKKAPPSDRKEHFKGDYGLTTLHHPPDPIADLVFVHGLNGGSQSTWTKGDESNFWPKSWLPDDVGFQDVRIHTFGYHSSVSRESILKIEDFSTSLLSAIHDAPAIPHRQNVPLILIGHSMGGLVIKMAFVLGQTISGFQQLVARVFAMFFLGVPHQGAQIAQALSRLLSLHGERPFVNELWPTSSTLSLLNDEFPRASQHLNLFSFFETKPMSYGIGKSLIVDRGAAVMGYPNERKTYLDANHRDVARFTSPEDPSYLTIRNALATQIDELREKIPIRTDAETVYEKDSHRQDIMRRFIHVNEAPEDDLARVQSLRVPGSCEWLLQRESFIHWRETLRSKGIYWLRGRPGAGKSVTAGAVISHLQEQYKDCCYFFFVRGDKTKIGNKSLLRSMAFQMAMLHPEILHVITDMATVLDEDMVNKNDANTIWRKLFTGGVLQVKLKRPQYWVIDALDEASGVAELLTFLSKAQEYWPLYIFVTSRNSIDFSTGTLNQKMEVMIEQVTEDDNYVDIALFLKSKSYRFPAPTHKAREEMAQRILFNSKGCFLWAQLVTNALLEVVTATRANFVIESNPSDMDALYCRIIDEMSKNRVNHGPVKAILKWATCSMRPLRLEELRYAISMDIKDEIGDMERFISDFCGNLVYVDKLDKLQLIHLTARELLIGGTLKSEYSIDRGLAHRRLALVCLECLLADDNQTTTRPPRLRKLGPIVQARDSQPLADYANDHVFHHLLQTDFYDDEILKTVTKFLKSTKILRWVEHIAKRREFQKVLSAGKTLDHIVRTSAAHIPPLSLQKERECMERWSSDLVRLVAKFGRRLLANPHSIHHLIPPLCPQLSAIHEQFCSPRGFTVVGLEKTGWDDCLSTISFPKTSRPNVVAASKENVGIGTSTGVILYDHNTLQETSYIQHEGPVWALALSENGRMVAMASRKKVRIYDIENDLHVQDIATKALCLSLTFAKKDSVLWIALTNNLLYCWDIASGAPRPGYPINWTDNLDIWGSELCANSPSLVVFCIELDLLAVVYRGEDVLLWNLEEQTVYDFYAKDMGSQYSNPNGPTRGIPAVVWDVAFSAAPGACLLAVAYFDGDLVVFDLEAETVVDKHPVYPQKICCSPDGRTLASGDSQGNISLFDFQTFKFLYKIQFESDALKVKTLAFTMDNLRLIELRSSQCRVWEPSALLRQEADENLSDISVSTAPLEIEYEATRATEITALTAVSASPLVFYGKEDGGVHVYDVSLTPQHQQLFVQTNNCLIGLVQFDAESSILTCCDAATRVTARRVHKIGNVWEVSEILLDTRPAKKIEQIMCSGTNGRLLISTHEHDTLWPLIEAHEDPRMIRRIGGSDHPRWVPHSDSDYLLRIEERGARVFTWKTLETRSFITFTDLDYPLTSSVIRLEHSRFFATISKESSSGSGSNSDKRSTINLWNTEDFDTSRDHSLRPVSNLVMLITRMEQVIGVVNDRLIFLDKDYWVCSIDLRASQVSWAPEFSSGSGSGSGLAPALRRRETVATVVPANIGPGDVTRHFFIPYDWISMVTKVLVGIGSRREFVFVKKSELAIVKKGLEVCETGVFHVGRALSQESEGLPTRPLLRRGFEGERYSI